MPTQYKVRVKNTSGTLQAELTDFIDLYYKNEVNKIGNAVIVLRDNHDAVQYFTDKALFEVWRKNDEYDIAWTRDFIGLVRDEERSFVDQHKRFIATIQGLNCMLGWRHVNYPAGTANLSTFTTDPAETIAKTLVDYNCASNATTGNGRKRNGAITNFVIEADAGNGNTLNWNCFGKNVLSELQDIALVGGGDFDVTLTGTNSFEFRWYDGQLGTDRTNTVLFSLDRGNMKNPVYKKERRGEKTIALVWGKGEGSSREYLTVTGSNYSTSNDIEVYVDARSSDDVDVEWYRTKGDEKLQETKAIDDFKFDVLQTPSSLYGKHYFLGDIVTAEYDDISVTPKVIGVTVNFSNQKEEIGIDLDNRYAT